MTSQHKTDDMEHMKASFADIMASIEQRMTSFEAELQKTAKHNSSAPTLSTLSADFASFRTFVFDTMSAFKKQMDVLAHQVDAIEMRSRRKMLLIHGIAEDKNEAAAEVVVHFAKQHLQVKDISLDDIRRCHRMGRATDNHKPRPLIVKFDRVTVRDQIWSVKSKLKGSGITLSEFLTRTRHDVFMAAREQFGVTKCWTREGHIFVLDPNGTQHRISSLSELSRLNKCTTTAKPVVSKPRRAAANKK